MSEKGTRETLRRMDMLDYYGEKPEVQAQMRLEDITLKIMRNFYEEARLVEILGPVDIKCDLGTMFPDDLQGAGTKDSDNGT